MVAAEVGRFWVLEARVTNAYVKGLVVSGIGFGFEFRVQGL